MAAHSEPLAAKKRLDSWKEIASLLRPRRAHCQTLGKRTRTTRVPCAGKRSRWCVRLRRGTGGVAEGAAPDWEAVESRCRRNTFRRGRQPTAPCHSNLLTIKVPGDLPAPALPPGSAALQNGYGKNLPLACASAADRRLVSRLSRSAIVNPGLRMRWPHRTRPAPRLRISTSKAAIISRSARLTI